MLLHFFRMLETAAVFERNWLNCFGRRKRIGGLASKGGGVGSSSNCLDCLRELDSPVAGAGDSFMKVLRNLMRVLWRVEIFLKVYGVDFSHGFSLIPCSSRLF